MAITLIEVYNTIADVAARAKAAEDRCQVLEQALTDMQAQFEALQRQYEALQQAQQGG